MLKPMVNYVTAVWEFDHSALTEHPSMSYLLKAMALLTTVIPLKTMESLHCALLPMTRMRRSTIKRVYVSFLGPIVQIQQTVLGVAFSLWHFDEAAYSRDITAKYRWVVWYGLLLGAEMVLFSLMTVFPFNPRDLRLWQYSETLISSGDDIEMLGLDEQDGKETGHEQTDGYRPMLSYRSRGDLTPSDVSVLT